MVLVNRHKNKLRLLVWTLIALSASCKPTQDLPDPLKAGWNGQSVCELVEENSKLRVLKCTFPPNVGHEKHVHAPHIGYTITGGRFKITDSSGTREVTIPVGYTFKNDRTTIHEVLNIGTTTAEFLIIEYK